MVEYVAKVVITKSVGNRKRYKRKNVFHVSFGTNMTEKQQSPVDLLCLSALSSCQVVNTVTELNDSVAQSVPSLILSSAGRVSLLFGSILCPRSST